MPGQFINIACADSRSYDPLLRRPFSVYQANEGDGTFSVLYVLRGRGTMFLKDRRPGEMIDCVGPLGNGFDVAEADVHLLVAGGCGAAPLALLGDHLKRKFPQSQIKALLGAQTALGLLCESDFALAGVQYSISTEDASRGRKGMVTDILKDELKSSTAQTVRVYACGPNEMLKKVAENCARRRVRCQVSMETSMACGVGVCVGCAVKVKDAASPTGWNYERCCVEGPVFDAERIWCR
jgi:dihydroorotate dehydrogenase electron transfer subunit